MSKSVCSGTIRIGTLNIPVSIYKSHDLIGLEGSRFHEECGGSIRMNMFCEDHPEDESPEIYTGIPVGDTILRITSEDRNEIFDRKLGISVEGCFKLTMLKNLISSGDLVVAGHYVIRPQTSTRISWQVDEMFSLLMSRLKAKNSFLLIQAPLCGAFRYAVVTSGGSVLALAYEQEIRGYPDIPDAGRSKLAKDVDRELEGITGSVLPTSFSAEHFEKKINTWVRKRLDVKVSNDQPVEVA